MSADVTRYLTPRGALGYKLDDAERYLRVQRDNQDETKRQSR
ncbi:hypothetical protein [Sinorhizobium medicae]|nr:hypothetical protein [Sinorhizobium medicae]